MPLRNQEETALEYIIHQHYDAPSECQGRSFHRGSRLLQQNGKRRAIQDPYVVLTVGSNRQRTRTCQEGGRTPQWNQTFTFAVNPQDCFMKVEAWDEDPVNDDFIGETTINIEKYRVQPQVTSEYVQLQKKSKKNAGRVMMSIQYINPGTGTGSSLMGYNNTPNQYYGQANYSAYQQGMQQGNYGVQPYSSSPSFGANSFGYQNQFGNSQASVPQTFNGNGSPQPGFDNLTATTLQALLGPGLFGNNSNSSSQSVPYQQGMNNAQGPQYQAANTNPYAMNNGWGPMPSQPNQGGYNGW